MIQIFVLLKISELCGPPLFKILRTLLYGAEINAAVMTFKYDIPTVYTVFRMLLIVRQ